ncbi:hypothetical protein ALI22I_20165 [Saccharothrix sp. ALI-22-I]|uniref:DUF4913 domain-containing protein n=1 Tax=Saccharothrix sp. ALI-22-I TaxID=1933778 RepID=UPI00097C3EE0|nr:DUF4913 domain-containing protein [Saccharothrix sp. ALI-22-I]ONI88058.1 hypothetical protein ALI22I_20165 [Saccharothrix sp. ALI-22-I]
MTAPDRLAQLEQRVAALEADNFELVTEVHELRGLTQWAAKGLDDVETSVRTLAMHYVEHADTLTTLTRQGTPGDDPDGPDGPGPSVFDEGLFGAYGPDREPGADSGAGGPVAGGVDVLFGGGDLVPLFDGGAPPPDGTPTAGATPGPDLPVLHAWVETHIAPMVRKTSTSGEGNGIRWCRTWWLHHDAVQRFIALFLSWHELSGEESATWLSVYLRDHLDPHLSTLTSPFGPFYLCSPTRHSDATQPLGQADLSQAPAPGATA